MKMLYVLSRYMYHNCHENLDILILEASKKQMTKFMSTKFTNISFQSNIILEIERIEDKQCRSKYCILTIFIFCASSVNH